MATALKPPDCTDTNKLINEKSGGREGIILLALLTKLHFECLKLLEESDRTSFPESQEQLLLNKIEAEVISLKKQLVQLDAEHLKFIQLVLDDYKNWDDVILKKNSVEYLLLNYQKISKVISGIEEPQGDFNDKISSKVMLLKKWKVICKNFDEDNEIKIERENNDKVQDYSDLDKVDKYINTRRDAESLNKVYSIIEWYQGYMKPQGLNIETRRSVLQTVLQNIGENLKSTSDTPNLSKHIKQSLERNGLPIEFLTGLRDQLVHHQVLLLKFDIKKFGDGLDAIKKIVQGKIIEIEKDLIKFFVQENAPKITNEVIRENLKSYAEKSVTELVQYIKRMKEEGGPYHSLDDSKKLVDEIYDSALQMKSKNFPVMDQGSLSESNKKKINTQSDIESKMSIEKTNVNMDMKTEFASWGLGLDKCLDDISDINTKIAYLESESFHDVYGVLKNFPEMNVLGKIRTYDNGEQSFLKDQLKLYIDLHGFKDKLPYSSTHSTTDTQKLIKVLKSATENQQNEEQIKNNENKWKYDILTFQGKKEKIINFLKSYEENSKKTLSSGYLKPDDYERLVKDLKLSKRSEEQLLSVLVEWKRKKCVNLLQSNPTAFKVIWDRIIEGKEINYTTFEKLAYQYPGIGDADFLKKSFEKNIAVFYSKITKEKINVLGSLSNPYVVKTQFFNIYSLLMKTNKEVDDPYVIRSLRNHLAHEHQSELFKQEFLSLIQEAVKIIKTSEEPVTLTSFNSAFYDAQSKLQLTEIQKVAPIEWKTVDGPVTSIISQSMNKFCAEKSTIGSGTIERRRRSIAECLFSKEDVVRFSKENVDENGVKKVIIDSEKFLTYIKSSQDEAKNAQLIKYIADKSIEGDYRYLAARVIQNQGYERYIQNERINDSYGDISRQDVRPIKSSKLITRLKDAAGKVQLVTAIHGVTVSCMEQKMEECGLGIGIMAWSYAYPVIGDIIVKNAPKAIETAGQFLLKVAPGTLGKQSQFAIQLMGQKYIAQGLRGALGAVGGAIDIFYIGMSANNLVDCKKRENSDSPCTEKEIRDNIASISFSGVSFVSGVAFTAASMSGVGLVVEMAIIVGQGIYGGVSNIVEYEGKYDTTNGENWSILWRTVLNQPMASDVIQLVVREYIVNTQAERAWKALRNSPADVFAYGIGFGLDSDITSPLPGYGKILMNITDADTTNLSRVIPKAIQNATMICLPQITGEQYEKGKKQSVATAVHYCENAMVIADESRNRSGTTMFYDLMQINKGTIVGSNELNNYFSIFKGNADITGGNDVVNKFFIVNPGIFAGKITGGTNATNVFDLSESLEHSVVNVEVNHRFKLNKPGSLIMTIENHRITENQIGQNATAFRYSYIGRQDKVDNVLCKYHFTQFNSNDDRNVLIDSGGSFSKEVRDNIHNCKKVVVSPFTRVTGIKGYYTFYIKTNGYQGKDLHSEIDVKGGGTLIFLETALLDDCNEIAYSSNYLSNSLSVKMGLGQGNQYTLEIKNYINKRDNKPNFVLIDKNGSNIIPRIGELESSNGEVSGKIVSFELHIEHFLDSFDAVEAYYKKMLSNNKYYKVFSILERGPHSQISSVFQHIVFGSSASDIINCNQKSMFTRGGNGSDVYVLDSKTEKRDIIIDNSSDDKTLDVLVLPEVPRKFVVLQCDLHIRVNNTNIQVRNYLHHNSNRHLVVMNSKGETFVPYVESMLCVDSPIDNGKLLLFLQATPTQNIFLLSKDFRENNVVIDSRLEDIERYKDKNDLLLVIESEIPFMIKLEDYYNDVGKWRDVNFQLWNSGNFSPYSGLEQEINEVMEYQDKLKSDYEQSFREYVIDFTQSVSIRHNQDFNYVFTLTYVGEDDERIGVMIFKHITPDRIQVSSSGRDLLFSDKISKHVINILNWDKSESYRVSTLEFDLGLEPMIIRRLDKFSLSDVAAIQYQIYQLTLIFQKKIGCETEGKSEGLTPLHCAAKNGSKGMVKYLIEVEGVDPNIQDSYRRTPLHLAAAGGSLEIVKYLIEEKGVNPNIMDVGSKTPLDFAAISGSLDIVKYLLKEKGVSVSAEKDKNLTPLHYAAQNGNIDVVKYLIVDEGADPNVKTRAEETPLHLAAGSGHLNVVKYLLEKNPANLSLRSRSGQTLLHYAIDGGNLELIKYLIEERNADVNVRDRYKQTPLHVGAFGGNLEIVKYLLEKNTADINMKDSSGQTLLHLAAFGGNLEMVKYLIEMKNADINIKDVSGNTLMHYATKGGNLALVRYLIEDKGVDISENDLHTVKGPQRIEIIHYLEGEIDKRKATSMSIYQAARENQTGVVRALIAKGVSIQVPDSGGWTPLHWASSKGHLDLVKYLVSKEANITAKTKDGKSPLDLAIVGKHNEVEKYLNQVQLYLSNDLLRIIEENNDIDEAKQIINRGADVNARNDAGLTALHLAARGGDLNLVEKLIEEKADVNAEDNEGSVPLKEAISKGNLDIVTYLMLIGADVWASANDGKTLIHFAALASQEEIVELLTSKGGNIDERDNADWTPLHCAAYEGLLDMVKYLVTKEADISAKTKGGKSPLELAIEGKHDNIEIYLKQVQWDLNIELLRSAESNNIDIVKHCIERGADVNARNDAGLTALHLAARGGDFDLVVKLIEKKADVNAKDNEGSVPLKEAISKGNLSILTYLMLQGADVRARANDGKTLIHFAALASQEEIVELLTRKGGNIDERDNADWTPLHCAAYEGLLDMVKYLITKEADISAKTKGGKSPLELAIEGKHHNIEIYLKQVQWDLNIELLRSAESNNIDKVKHCIERGADVNARNDAGLTALHLAARGGDFDLVVKLIEKKADVNAKDNEGSVPLKEAISKGNLSILTYLMLKGADVRARANDGKTLIHFAALASQEEIVELLTRKGGNIDERDNADWTPLHCAAYEGLLDMVKYLITKEADISAKTKGGKSPLELAIEGKHHNIEIYLKQVQWDLNIELLRSVESNNIDKVKHCIKRGAKSTDEMEDGSTALHWAAGLGNLDAIMYFVAEKHADTNLKCKYGYTPLHYATIGGHLDIVKYLIEERHADGNILDYQGTTPLRFAIEGGYSDIVKYLIANAINDAGLTALHLAARKRRDHHGYSSFNHISPRYLSEDSDSDPKVLRSGGAMPSSWIRDLFGWVNKGAEAVKGMVVDWLTDNTAEFRPESEANTSTSAADTCGTVLLLDTLIRKATGQKHISVNVSNISVQEASGYAINITEGFENIIKRAARKSKISMNQLDIDFSKVQGEITKVILSGRYTEILEVVNSHVHSLSDVDKLNVEELSKFVTTIDEGLNLLFNQSITILLNSKDKYIGSSYYFF